MGDFFSILLNPNGRVYQLLIALFLGAFIGLRRELILQQEKRKGVIGLRTMPLLVLLGTISTFFPSLNQLPLIMFLGIIIFMIIAYYNGVFRFKRIGLTTELTGLIMFLVGVIIGNGEILLATIITVLVGVFNAYKEQLHNFAKNFSFKEWTGSLQLLIITLVILPILPREPIDPWGLIIPFNIWFFVVLISGLSFIGYFLNKHFDGKKSVYLTSALGSVVSSTAITTSLAMKSKVEKNTSSDFFVSLIMLATTIMEIRLLIIIFIFDGVFHFEFVAVLFAMLITTIILFLYTHFKLRNAKKVEKFIQLNPKLSSPFEIVPALKFAIFFVIFLIIIGLAQEYFSNKGVYVASFLYSLTETEVPIISVLQSLNINKLAFDVTWRVISIIVLVNTFVKIIYVYLFGRRDLFKKLFLYIFTIVAVGTITFFLL